MPSDKKSLFYYNDWTWGNIVEGILNYKSTNFSYAASSGCTHIGKK